MTRRARARLAALTAFALPAVLGAVALHERVLAAEPNPILAGYHLGGSVTPFRDPSIIRVGDAYYVFGTDTGDFTFSSLPMRCSTDKVTWLACGSVFKGGVPQWVKDKIPDAAGLWAPDISFFNGLYHVYYAASVFGTNRSSIGLATNPTLDRKDPAYKWTDLGPVLSSGPGDRFNAIDPNILVDGDGAIWMSYGSFWSGIKQRRIDPATGMLSREDGHVYDLASRPDDRVHAIEAASLVRHDRYYYLFTSFGACCDPDPKRDDYRIVVGRGDGPHGPFLDRHGQSMIDGQGEEILKGDGVTFNGTGGQTVYIDPERGDLITFHALKLPAGQAYLFVNPLKWVDGWPVIEP